MKSKIILKFFFIFILILFSKNLYAGLTVTPTIIEIAVDKGKENLQVLSVGNTGENTINLSIILEKIKKRDIPIDDWLILQVKVFEIKPKDKVDVPYIITPPKDAEGELRGRIILVANEIGEERSPIGVRFNIPIYAVIQKTLKMGTEIKDLKIEYDSLKNVLNGTMLVENASNVHVRPNIDFRIENIASGEKSNYVIPYGQVVHKESSRYLFLKEENLELQPGRYKLLVNLDYGRMYGLINFIATKEVEFEVKPEPQIGTDLETQVNTDKGGSK